MRLNEVITNKCDLKSHINIKPIFIAAGCSQKTHISTSENQKIIYCSKSNIIIADEQKVENIISVDQDITSLTCKNNTIIAGGSLGKGYIIKNNKITTYDFDSGIEITGILNENQFVFSTLEKTYVFNMEKNEIEVEKVNKWFPTSLETYENIILIGTQSGEIYILDAFLNQKTVIPAHLDAIQDIKKYISDEDIYIATSSQDEVIKIWKLNEDLTFNHVQTLNGHTDWIYGINWIDNGDLLSSSADNTIIQWRKSNDKWENYMRMGGFGAFYNTFMIDNIIYGQSFSGGFYKFTRELTNYISGHTDEITSLDWNGDFLLSGSADKTSRLFFKNCEVARPQIHGYSINSAKFLTKCDLSFISAAQETILRVYEPTELLYMCCTYVENSDCNINNDISELSIDNLNTKKNYYDYFENLENYKFTAVPAELSLTNEVLSDYPFETVNEHLLSSTVFNEKRKIYGHYFEISSISVSEKYIASCNRSLLKKFAGIFIWTRDFKLKMYIEEHEYGIEKLCFSNCGKYLAAASKDKTASVYSLDDDIKLIKRLKDHKRIVWDCSFSHDSKYLVTCSRDKTILLYRAPEFMKAYEYTCDCEITSVCFSPTKQILVAGTEFGEIIIFELYDEKINEIIRFKSHSKKITAISFDDYGVRVAVGGLDGMIVVYKLN